jgi:dephospho-CoA kinase
MRVIGLTGGTGSGKSAAGKRFETQGIPVLDADAIGHEVIASAGRAEKAVVETFGEAIVTDGAIDRRKLGPRVFADPAARQTLNAIVHPAIREVVLERADALKGEGHKVALVDAALLGEDGTLQDYIEGLVLVLAERETRVDRLMVNRGLTRDQAEQRIDAQVPPERKRLLADWVIENNSTLDALYAQVDAVAKELLDDGD